ncbi:MAG: LysM peptidoglycan-binding domain-containing protein [Thermodesulfobacteriota bacterium]
MISIDTKTFEKLISDFIDARDIRTLVNNFSKDRIFYYNVLKDISRGQSSENYKILKKVAYKKKVSENFIIEQAKLVLGYIASNDKLDLDNFYKILNVSPNASDEKIRQHWIELMKSHHPDKVGQGGLDRAKQINEAYEMLSSPKKRADYDSKYFPDVPVIVKDVGMGNRSKMYLYIIPFILVMGISYFYLSSSELFKSEIDKVSFAKKIGENPTLPDRDIKNEQFYRELEPSSKLVEPDKQTQNSEDISTNDMIAKKSPNINKEITPPDIYAKNEQPYRELEPNPKLVEPDKQTQNSEDISTNDKIAKKSPNIKKDVTPERLIKQKNNSKQEQSVALNIEIKEETDIKNSENSLKTAPDELPDYKTKLGQNEISLENMDSENRDSQSLYVVKKGDSLWTISRKFGVSVEDISKQNKLPNNNLDVGDQIVIRVPDKEKIDPATESITEFVKIIPDEKELENDQANEEWIAKNIGNHAIDNNTEKKSPNIKKDVTPERLIKQKNNSKQEQSVALNIEIKEETDIKNSENSLKTAPDELPDYKTKLGQNEISLENMDSENQDHQSLYVVKKGDSLWIISRKFGVSVEDISKQNKLINNKLDVGDQLVIRSEIKEDTETGEENRPKFAKIIPDESKTKKNNTKPEIIETKATNLSSSSDVNGSFDANLATSVVAINNTKLRKNELSPDMSSPDEDSLNRFVLQYVSAYKNRDLQTLTSLFTPNAKENGVSINKFLDSYKSNFSTLEIIRYDINVDRAKVDKLAGVVMGDFSVTFRNVSERLTRSSQGKITWILRWRGNKWQIEEINYKIHDTNVIDS